MAPAKRSSSRTKRASDSAIASPQKEAKPAGPVSAWGIYMFVENMDRAIDFYTKVLGFQLRYRHENKWAEVTCGSMVLGLHGQEGEHKARDGPADGVGSQATLCLQVDGDIVALVESLKAQGVRFHKDGLVESPQGKVANMQDSEGNWLYLMEPPKYS